MVVTLRIIKKKQKQKIKMETKYAVFRSNVRVSDTIYTHPEQAKEEVEMWKRIIAKYPDGSVIEVKEIRS